MTKRMSIDEAVELIEKADLKTLGKMALARKKEMHSKGVTTFVVDRNINYTNICWVDCKFCAFYTHEKKEDAYILTFDEIDQKIDELQEILLKEQNDEIAAELITLLDDRQAHNINIHRANIASKINIGGSDMDIATAIIIRDGIADKVSYTTELIDNPDSTLDKLELMKQRDRYFEEYTLIDMGIQKNDLNVTLS